MQFEHETVKCIVLSARNQSHVPLAEVSIDPIIAQRHWHKHSYSMRAT